MSEQKLYKLSNRIIWPVFLSIPSRRQDSPLPPIFSGSLGTHNERIVSQQFSHKDTPSLFFIAAVNRKSGKLKKEKRSIKPILSIFYKNVKFVVSVFLCCLWQLIILFMAVNNWCIERPVARGGTSARAPPPFTHEGEGHTIWDSRGRAHYLRLTKLKMKK